MNPTNPQPSERVGELGEEIDLLIDHAEIAASKDNGMYAGMDNNPMNRQVIAREVREIITRRIQAFASKVEAEVIGEDEELDDAYNYDALPNNRPTASTINRHNTEIRKRNQDRAAQRQALSRLLQEEAGRKQ